MSAFLDFTVEHAQNVDLRMHRPLMVYASLDQLPRSASQRRELSLTMVATLSARWWCTWGSEPTRDPATHCCNHEARVHGPEVVREARQREIVWPLRAVVVRIRDARRALGWHTFQIEFVLGPGPELRDQGTSQLARATAQPSSEMKTANPRSFRSSASSHFTK